MIHSSSLVGVKGVMVKIEVEPSRGGLEIIGMREMSVRESRVRILSSLDTIVPLPTPSVRVTIEPSSNSGAPFDLPIAVAMLAIEPHVRQEELATTLIVGELSLAGEIRYTRGVLPMLRAAKAAGITRAIIPENNAIDGHFGVDHLRMDIRLAASIRDVHAWLRGKELKSIEPNSNPIARFERSERLDDVVAPKELISEFRRAIEAWQNVLLVGPPGTGKTMLARRALSVLPPITQDELLEIATIASASGLPITANRPFRAPHYTCSVQALIGGGKPIRPGEVTLANHGVLFLDELTEFRRQALEALLHVVFGQRERNCILPAKPIVIASMTPCPCGYHGDDRHVCRCSPERIQRHVERIRPIERYFQTKLILPRMKLA